MEDWGIIGGSEVGGFWDKGIGIMGLGNWRLGIEIFEDWGIGGLSDLRIWIYFVRYCKKKSDCRVFNIQCSFLIIGDFFLELCFLSPFH